MGKRGPKADPATARRLLVVRVAPETMDALEAEAKAAGTNKGRVIDKWAKPRKRPPG